MKTNFYASQIICLEVVITRWSGSIGDALQQMGNHHNKHDRRLSEGWNGSLATCHMRTCIKRVVLQSSGTYASNRVYLCGIS